MSNISVITANNIRSLIKEININNINKNDIINILKEGTQFVLIYDKK